MRRQWFYRGSLKSCNYHCSYCPFSKKKGNEREWEKDKKALFRFVERMNSLKLGKEAVLIVPYGEALIHKHYWEALASLSANPHIEAVGAQSNFSFSAERMLSYYSEMGGDLKKLRLWGTFHPEMTSIENFVGQCEKLSAYGAAYCVGAVGDPSQLSNIRALRKALPPEVYLWINKMDGMKKRSYERAEIDAFLEIDAYFELELARHQANGHSCGNQLFVEADGTMRRCNLCHQNIGNIYRDCAWLLESDNDADNLTLFNHPEKSFCTRKECSCFLSYCNRKEEQLLFFQPYPAFRIPSYPKALFLDVDGTLIPPGETQIPERYVRWLTRLADRVELFLATSLPYEIAKKKTKAIWPLLCGGVFAGGARIIINKPCFVDEIAQIESGWLRFAEQKQKEYGYRLHIYKKDAFVYKATLSFPKGRTLKHFLDDELKLLKKELKIPDSCQLAQEDNCIQITKIGCEKKEGVITVCKRKGYTKEDVVVVGNADNDCQMLEAFPFSVAAKESSWQAKSCASISL